jgi:hypothetical protein
VAPGDHADIIPRSVAAPLRYVMSSMLLRDWNTGASLPQVALFLISERAEGGASPWAAYINTIPEQPPSPLFWGAAERELLAGTQLLQTLQSYECAHTNIYQPCAAGSRHDACRPLDSRP